MKFYFGNRKVDWITFTVGVKQAIIRFLQCFPNLI